MSKPEIKSVGSGYIFTWVAEKIEADVSRIREHSERTTAEVCFRTTKNDVAPHIVLTQLNLLSSQSRKSFVRDLEDRYQLGEAAWTSIVEQMCVHTLEKQREGVPVEEIWPLSEDEPIPPIEFLIKPLLYKDKHNLFYGDGGSGKTELAIILSLVVQFPEAELDLPFFPASTRENVLYLDWESDRKDFRRRQTQLQRGLGFPPVGIRYRQCLSPLVNDIDHLVRIVNKEKIGLVVIDSLGVASGSSNLNEVATATAFYSAIRQFKTTTLIITHTAKDKESKRTTPFGSVFFSNLARSVYEIKHQQELGSNEMSLAIYHRKVNQGPLLGSVGIQFTFEEEKTLVERLSVEDVPELLDRLSTKQKIVDFLSKYGKADCAEIADRIGSKPDTVRKNLNRHKKTFTKIDDTFWGLAYQGQTDDE